MANLRRRILFLDFDGVLHAQSEDDQTIATLPIEDLLAAQPGLFRWAPLLAEILRGSDCQVVVHSSWRRYIDDAGLRVVLGPLAARFIGTTSRSLQREESILEYVRRQSERIADYRVLDDQPHLFTSGRLDAKLVACDQARGVSEARVASALRGFLGNSP